MANKKRIATSVAAVATAAALLLGGTFAWQSISQRALNEASDVINPGGRLHNDLWYEDAKTTNNDIYVENFTDPDADGDDIYARVRLSEYMEIVMNYGTAAEKVETVAGNKTPVDATTHSADEATEQDAYTYEYDIHYFGDDNATDEYWTWDTDGSDAGDVYYMPTFNKNKDSLAPDLNGLYRDRVGGISDREVAQYHTALDDTAVPAPYEVNGTKDGFEIYDGDTNSDDELKTLDAVALEEIIANGTEEYADNIVLTDEKKTHTADTIDTTKGLVSMEWWLNEVGYDAATGEAVSYDEDAHGNYWVYDTDGWVYWSGAIGAGETTGLLLDSFTLKEVMDDTWYYAIEAEGEFVTADDLGMFDPAAAASTFNLRSTPVASPSDLPYYEGGTGFYENGISKEALALLNIIGVGSESSDEDEGGESEEIETTFSITDDLSATPYVALVKNDSGTARGMVSWYDEGWNYYEELKTSTEVETYSLYMFRTADAIEEKNANYTLNGKQLEEVWVLNESDSYEESTAFVLPWTCNVGDEENSNGYYNETLGDLYGEVITSVELLSTIKPASTANWFSGFQACTSYNLAKLDTSNTTDMSGMFWYNSAVTSLDLSHFDTTKVTNFADMFWLCESLTEIKGVEQFNTKNATQIRGMFGYSNIASLDLSGWNTSGITSLQSMFAHMPELTYLNLSNWDISEVSDMYRFCGGNTKLSTLILPDAWDTSHVTTMEGAFMGCTSLTLDCSDWDVSSVETYIDNHDGFNAIGYDDENYVYLEEKIESIIEPTWPIVLTVSDGSNPDITTFQFSGTGLMKLGVMNEGIAADGLVWTMEGSNNFTLEQNVDGTATVTHTECECYYYSSSASVYVTYNGDPCGKQRITVYCYGY